MNLFVDVKKRFQSGRTPFALDAVFTAPPGITVLFGPSGAGKSTTLDCVAGIAVPDRGTIRVGDRTVFERDAGRRPTTDVALRERRVGYVFQRLGLFEHMTVLDNVLYGLNRRPRAEALTVARSMLEQFHIGHTADRRPAQLSGGERRRVALARTLVVRPDVLLLDEPLSALDAATKRSLIAVLLDLRQRLDIPILYVSHDPDEVSALGERVLVFERGAVVAQGTPADVVNRRPINETVFQTGQQTV